MPLERDCWPCADVPDVCAKGVAGAALIPDLHLDTFARRASKRQRPKTLRETERHLRVHLRPLPTKPAAGIIRADIAGRLQELVEASGPIAASGCRSALHALFVWAMRSGLLEANPLMNTDRPGEERTRDRVVSDDELCQVWAATEGPGDYNAIVRLLILTGQRREEVGGMRRDEIDLAPGFVVAAG